MRNKKAFEMTISTVVVLVIALILLGVGIYIIYSKILKPTDGTTSILSCDARGGDVVLNCKSCTGVCLTLPSGPENKLLPCCIRKTS